MPASSSIRSIASAAAIRTATSVGNASGTGLSSTTIRTAHRGQPLSPPRSALSRTDWVMSAASSASVSPAGNQPCSTVTPVCSSTGSAFSVTVACRFCPPTIRLIDAETVTGRPRVSL